MHCNVTICSSPQPRPRLAITHPITVLSRRVLVLQWLRLRPLIYRNARLVSAVPCVSERPSVLSLLDPSDPDSIRA